MPMDARTDEAVSAYLLSNFPNKAVAVAKCTTALSSEAIEFLSDLENFSYDEICNMGVPKLFAKKLEVEGYLKVTVAGGIGRRPVIDYLRSTFTVFLKAARQVPGPDMLREGDNISITEQGTLAEFQPGSYFCLKGRSLTLESLVKGCAGVFENLYLPGIQDDKQRQPHFNAIIGYPGAGKSTIGKCFPLMLRRFWMGELPEAGKLIDLVPTNVRNEYERAMWNSWNFNAFMYHSLADSGLGDLVLVERELAATGKFQQILALRCLYASITTVERNVEGQFKADYGTFIELMRDYATLIDFKDILQFIREGMGVPEGSPLFLSFFFDEVNSARAGPSGRSVTWMQETLSEYVRLFSDLYSKTATFPLITLATTKHESSSMIRTGTAKSLSYPIPIPPLKLTDAAAVILDFMRRLANSIEGAKPVIDIPEHLGLCIKMTGGMPRLLSYMVRGLVTSDSHTAIDAKRLLQRLQDFGPTDYEYTLNNLLALANWNREKYSLQFGGSLVLLSAVRTSCLEMVVHRGQLVHEKISHVTWGTLEERGLVSLDVQDTQARRDPADDPCCVSFPPVLFWHLVQLESSPLCHMFPKTMERGWRNKDEYDLKFLIFMIRLFKLTQPDAETFRLRDIIPRSWDMGEQLKHLLLQVPSEKELYHCLRSGTRVGGVPDAIEEGGVLGCGNDGINSVLKISGIYIVTQSKCSDDPKEFATATDIYNNVWSNIHGFFNVAGAEMGAFQQVSLRNLSDQKKAIFDQSDRQHNINTSKLPLERLIYIYNTDGEIQDSYRQAVIKSRNEVCSRIIISKHAETSPSPLNKVSRHIYTYTGICSKYKEKDHES